MAIPYDAGTAQRLFRPTNSATRDAQIHATEALLHDLAELGLVEFFEGPGDNPTGLTGYASTKLWLRQSAGVQATPGEVRSYDGSGDQSTLAAWPIMDQSAWVGYLANIDYVTASSLWQSVLQLTTASASLAALGAAPLASPALTGTPTAPTAPSSTNGTQIATTQFVQTVLGLAVGAAGGALYATRAALYADLVPGDKASAWVYADTTIAYNGIYVKSGGTGTGSWSRVLDLPYRTAPATFSGSVVTLIATVANPEATSADIIYGTAATFPRGTTTLTLAGTGSPLPFRHLSGRELNYGDWKIGDLLVVLNMGTEFRLISPSSKRSLASVQLPLADAVLPSVVPKMAPRRYDYAVSGSGVTGTSRAVPAKDHVLHLYPISGQSLANGAVTGPVLATTALYPGRAFRPRTGMRLSPSFRINELVPALETSGGSNYDSPASSMLWHIIDKVDDVVSGNNLRLASFVSALGDQYYYQLRRGSKTYERLIEGVASIVEKSDMQVVVPGIVWVHGTNDTQGTPRHVYAGMLRQLQRDFDTDIRRVTGQDETVVLFLPQVNRMQWDDGIWQKIHLAQMDVADDPHIRMIGPHYFAENGDTVHKSADGATDMGMMFARAIEAEIYGTGWQPLRMRECYFVSSTVIQVDCEVPVSPLVLDTSGDVDPTGLPSGNNNGFDVQDPDGNSLTISSVAVYNDTSVRLTLSAAPSASSFPFVAVAYAMRKNSALDGSGPITGARGCIRDSEAHQCLLRPSRQTSNWLCAFAVRVPVTA